ncbi:MAG: GAF domain-containing protein [Desulfobulbaceae bacterium]|nr:GAF domain-containing protein [Desulfobulbaceae bacterium]HIJ89870.1 GAF domain-containing protein [Deltaproteobacteria bacterium]
MRLRSIIFLVFVVIGLFPLATSIVFNLPQLIATLEQSVQDQRLARLQDEFAALGRRVEQGRETLRIFGMLSETVDLVGRPEPGIPLVELRERLSDVVAKRWFRNRPEVLSVSVLDGLGQEQFRVSRRENGELGLVSSKIPDKMEEKVSRTARVFLPGTTFVGAIQGVGALDKEGRLRQLIVYFGVPVQNEAYGTSGIALLSLDLHLLIKNLEKYDLVSQDGVYLASAVYGARRQGPGQAFVDFPRLRQAMHDGKPVILKNLRGEAHVWLPLIGEEEGENSLWVGQPVDRSAIEIWLQRYKQNLGMIVLALVMVLVGVAVAMAHYANHLHGQLLGGFASILEGKKKPRLNWRWPVEHVRLAADLDALAENYLADRAARRAAEEEVRREREHALVTLRSIGDAVITTDTCGVVTRMNVVAEQLTGWPQAEALGRKLDEVFNIIDSGTGGKSVNPVALVLETGKMVGLGNHTVLIARDGKEYQVADSAAPILGQDGENLGVVVVFRDVTEEYALQAQLAHELTVKQALADLAGQLVGSGQSLASIARTILAAARELTASPHGYVGIVDAKSGHLVCHAFTEMMGVGEDRELEFSPGPDGRYPGLWGRVLNEGQGEYTNDPDSHAALGCAEGDIAVQRFLAVPVLLGSQLVGLIAVANAGRDYTEKDLDLLLRVATPCALAIKGVRAAEERERLMTALRQSQKIEAVGTLAGGVAHDFNNMLTPILGYTDLVMAKLPPGDPMRQDLGEVKKSALRAKNLVRQILAFSRQKGPELVCLALPPVLEECLKMLRSTLPSTVVFREDLATDCGCIMADSIQIQQVLINLCTNAAHAMEESGGTLEVSLREIEVSQGETLSGQDFRSGRYLRLVVGDTGCGMDKATLERIFEPYFTTKEQGKGTGIGLALVYGIVKGYGGYLSVYSEPGQGTTVSLYLPVCCDVGGQSAKVVDFSIPQGSERLLLVDDEEDVLKMLKEMSEYLGYKVMAVSNSAEAYDVFSNRADAFDLVVTDQTMPGMTGVALAEKILTLKPGMPIIICTGFSEGLTEGKARQIGIAGYIMKPVVMGDFARLIRRVLVEGGAG